MKYETLCKKIKDGGMGLLNFADHSRKIWNKMVRVVLTSHDVSPFTAFGLNWGASNEGKCVKSCGEHVLTSKIKMDLHETPTMGGNPTER